MSNDFLKSISFLSDEDRIRLSENGYDDLDSLTGTSQEELIRIGIKSGIAAKLKAFSVRKSDHLEKNMEILNLFAELGGENHSLAVKSLREKGYYTAVVSGDNKIDVKLNADFIADGCPNLDWYGSGQVVRIEDVGGKPLHHPRSGIKLTRGDAIPWHVLGKDKLIVCAAIFATPDILAGESDRSIFKEALDMGEIFKTMKMRIERDSNLKRRAENIIDGEIGVNVTSSMDITSKVIKIIDPVLRDEKSEVKICIYNNVNDVDEKSFFAKFEDAEGVQKTIVTICNSYGLRCRFSNLRGTGRIIYVSR